MAVGCSREFRVYAGHNRRINVDRPRAADDLAKIRMRIEALRRERAEALRAEDDWGQRSASKVSPARFVTGKAR